MKLIEVGGFLPSWLAFLLLLPLSLLFVLWALTVGAALSAYRDVRDIIQQF